MAHKGYFEIGKIVKPHGFNGALKLKITHPKANEIDFPESVFMEFHHKLVPFFYTAFNPQSNGFAIVSFDHITTEADAKEVAGQAVYLPADLEPIPEGKDFYHDELINFKVSDVHLGDLGILANVMEAPANDVFEINHPSGKEILIPVLDNFIVEIKRDSKELILEAPQDLVDFYLHG